MKNDEWVDVISIMKARFGDNCDESATLARFVAKHAREFSGKGEHDLEDTALHEEYLRLWESEMEVFCRRQGIELADLQQQMYDALHDRYTALFEEHPHHGWVDSALAALSFEHFSARMRCRK